MHTALRLLRELVERALHRFENPLRRLGIVPRDEGLNRRHIVCEHRSVRLDPHARPRAACRTCSCQSAGNGANGPVSRSAST